MSRQSSSTMGSGPPLGAAADHAATPEAGPLRGPITDLLRASILSGRLQPGVIYSARSFARQLDVSPTPVREALFELVREGLLEPRPNRGFVLCRYSDADQTQLASVLFLLEAHVFQRDTGIASDCAVSVLEQHASQTRVSAAGGDLGAFLESEDRFHHRLCLLSGNRALGETVLELRARVRLHYLTESAPPGDLAAKAAEHFELLRLLRLGESASAVRLLKRHILGDREEGSHAVE